MVGEVGVSLVAFNAARGLLVVTHNRIIRVVDENGERKEGEMGRAHEGVIRSVQFSDDGAMLATAGDDKHVRLWACDSFRLLASCTVPKKITSIAFVTATTLACGTKCGDVFTTTIHTTPAATTLQAPGLVFGHYSICTAVATSPDRRFLCSADTDEKIRVAVVDSTLLEIQAFCLGHTEFVSALCAVPTHPTAVVSGGGDGVVRLWDVATGAMVHHVALPQAEREPKEGEGEEGEGVDDGAEGAAQGDSSQEEGDEEGDEGGDGKAKDNKRKRPLGGGREPLNKPRSASPRAPVIALACDALGRVVVGVEGSPVLSVFRVGEGELARGLQPVASVDLGGTHSPCDVAWGKGGQLLVTRCNGEVCVVSSESWQVLVVVGGAHGKAVEAVNQRGGEGGGDGFGEDEDKGKERRVLLEYHRRNNRDDDEWADVQGKVVERIAKKKRKMFDEKGQEKDE